MCPGFVCARVTNFSVYHYIHSGTRTHPDLYLVGAVGLSSGVKWFQHKVDHTPQSSVKVKHA